MINTALAVAAAHKLRFAQDLILYNLDVSELPSMIRVDGDDKLDFQYEEIAEALGWPDFGNDDFEEIMSTHYGRMVVLDDEVILFANPEDAAEYIGFDLQATGE